MLEASVAAVARTTTHRFRTSKPHWAHGHGELSLGLLCLAKTLSGSKINSLQQFPQPAHLL